MARPLAPLAGAVALWGLQACGVSYWMLAYQYADDDTGLAVRMARACVERGVCPSAGMPTSGLGLSHGASWIRLIGWCLGTAGSLGTLQGIVLALLVAAVVLAGAVVWRTVSWRAGLFASLFFLPATMATLRFDDLTNGTTTPLPLTAFFAATVWCVRSGGLLPAIGAGVALAAAMSTSLSSILLAPLLLALVALAARRPIVAVPAAALATAATFAVESSRAAAQLAHALVAPTVLGLGLLLGVVLASALVPAGRVLLRRGADGVRAWRRWFLALPALPRVRAAMRLAAIYLVGAGWIASLARPRIPDAHYFATAVFPLVLLAADATESLSRRHAALLIGAMLVALGSMLLAPLAVATGSLLSVLAAAVVSLAFLARAVRSRGGILGDLGTRAAARGAVGATLLVCTMSAPDALLYPRTRQLWPVVTAETMVRRLYASGFTFPALMGALQGQAPYTLQSMIASLDPDFSVEKPMADDAAGSVVAMIVDPALAARLPDVLARLDAPEGRTAVAVRAASVLDRARLRTCYADSCDAPIDPRWCVTRDPRGTMRHDRPYFPVRAAAAVDVPRDEPAAFRHPTATYCVRFSVPIRTSGSGRPHWLRVPDLWPLHARIRAVSGVAFEGALPGPEVRLDDDAPATGTVEVEVSAHGIGPESDWLEQPPLLEVDAANAALLEPFRRGRVTLR